MIGNLDVPLSIKATPRAQLSALPLGAPSLSEAGLCISDEQPTTLDDLARAVPP